MPPAPSPIALPILPIDGLLPKDEVGFQTRTKPVWIPLIFNRTFLGVAWVIEPCWPLYLPPVGTTFLPGLNILDIFKYRQNLRHQCPNPAAFPSSPKWLPCRASARVIWVQSACSTAQRCGVVEDCWLGPAMVFSYVFPPLTPSH
jgi:hypothetical protein